MMWIHRTSRVCYAYIPFELSFLYACIQTTQPFAHFFSTGKSRFTRRLHSSHHAGNFFPYVFERPPRMEGKSKEKKYSWMFAYVYGQGREEKSPHKPEKNGVVKNKSVLYVQHHSIQCLIHKYARAVPVVWQQNHHCLLFTGIMKEKNKEREKKIRELYGKIVICFHSPLFYSLIFCFLGRYIFQLWRPPCTIHIRVKQWGKRERKKL